MLSVGEVRRTLRVRLKLSGSAAFYGKFVVPNAPFDLAFNGRFTGPNAAELISAWRAPYLDPMDNVWMMMSGIWIGKKQ